jgi:hypothetical protein
MFDQVGFKGNGVADHLGHTKYNKQEKRWKMTTHVLACRLQ